MAREKSSAGQVMEFYRTGPAQLCIRSNSLICASRVLAPCPAMSNRMFSNNRDVLHLLVRDNGRWAQVPTEIYTY